MGLFITSITTTPVAPGTSVLSSASVTTTSSVILAANASRIKFTVWNEGNKAVLLALAGTASTSAYTVNLPVGAFYESELNDYTGAVSAVTASGTSTVKVTEETA